MGEWKFLEWKNKQIVDDINLSNNIIPNNYIYEAYIFGKQARLPFQKSKVGAVMVYSLKYQLIIHDVVSSIPANLMEGEWKTVSA